MLTNKQAIEYIDSILSNYNNPKEVDRHYPDYRLCEVWLSRYDIEAFEKAKDALRKLDKLNETLNIVKIQTRRTKMARTLNGQVLINDVGNLDEQCWITNLLACASLLQELKDDDEDKEIENGSN